MPPRTPSSALKTLGGSWRFESAHSTLKVPLRCYSHHSSRVSDWRAVGLLYADDLEKTPEPGEILRIASVKHQPVGMGGGSDQEVSNSAPVGATMLGNHGDDLTVTASGSDIEGNRFEGRFDLL